MMVYADEDGHIEHCDMRDKESEDSLNSYYNDFSRQRANVWRSHKNAVFDMAWLGDERTLVSQ